MFMRQPRSPASTQIGAGRLDVGDLVAHHLGRDLRILDAEGAAEAAADLGIRQLVELQPAHAREQPARLLLDAELAQARAGIVVGGARRQARLDRLDAAHVGEEADQLEGARGQVAGRGAVGRRFVEQRRIVLLQHAGAGAGRRHDVVVAGEGGDRLARDQDRIGAVALIVGRLAAAGLARHLDPAAGALQELDRGKADRGPEQIDQAGDEQGDVRLAHDRDARGVGTGREFSRSGDDRANAGAGARRTVAAQLVGIAALGSSTT